MTDWTKKRAAVLCAEYRDAVKRQRAMPLAEQWTRAAEIVVLKARALVALEAERLGVS